MRILHTSDWHLGKRLFKLERTEEHQRFLDWLLSTLIEQKIDVLLIAGDIFDTPTPPHHSLEMFYEFLHRVSVETKTQTLIIAGNHDSGQLLEAPAKILKMHRVKVWGKLSQKTDDHWLHLEIGGESLDVCAIPFFRSYELLPQGEGDAIAALRTYLENEKKTPKLLMLHHLAGMAEAAGSEQVISLTGVESIPTELLKQFDYVALGHIHKPQKMGDRIFYSGSPIPMRFSETYPKSVMQLELKNGTFTFEPVKIPVARQLISIHATLADWKHKVDTLVVNSELPPMAEVQLSLPQPQVGLIDEIKTALEKKGIELLSYLPTYSMLEKTNKKREGIFELTPVDLFTEFYAHKYPDAKSVPDDLMNDFKELIQKVNHASSGS